MLAAGRGGRSGSIERIFKGFMRFEGGLILLVCSEKGVYASILIPMTYIFRFDM